MYLNAFNGIRPINELVFTNCTFREFRTTPIQDNSVIICINTLMIQFMEFKNIYEHTFTKLSSLNELRLTNIKIVNLDQRFLEPLKIALRKLSIISLPNDFNLDEIFGFGKWQITFLELRSQSSKFRLIAPSNFSSLPKLFLSQIYDLFE